MKSRIAAYAALVGLIAFGVFAWNTFATPKPPEKPLSRQVMEYQESVIRSVKPPPTTAALQYAYTASAYADGIETGTPRIALQAAQSMLVMLYPERTQDITQQVTKLAQQAKISHFNDASTEAAKITYKYNYRYEHDGHTLVWDGIIPTGPGKWVKTSAKDPFTPRAGEWQRWNVQSAISVPPPPVFNSAEDIRQLAGVVQASATRNGQDINTINFWGGTPGSETPSGIWQNELFTTVKPDLPNSTFKADMKYAVLQKILAQTESDAFMECWKVKYTYWTARPNMHTTAITTAMENPNFPGYISGHSTISKAAADVLSTLVPAHTKVWNDMAMEARQSRLKAGIHYDIDNVVGFQVGTAVAEQTKQAVQLRQEL